MAPGNTSQSSDKPLSGLSLYAGISLNGGQSADAAGASTNTNTPQSAQGDPAAAGPTAAANPSKPSATAGSSSGWSAALRFAPRKSGSSSSAGNKSKAKNRLPVAASSSFAQSAAAPDDQLDVPTKHAATPNQKSASAVVRDVHGNAPGSSTTSSSSLKSTAAVPTTDTVTSQTPAKETVSTTTLVAPSTSSSVSKYALPVIQAPPELKLSEGEVEAEKNLIRQGALARGEVKQQQQQWQNQEDYYDGDQGYEEDRGGWAGKRTGQQQQRQADEDEDVNGFRFSEAGARANKKKKYKRKRGNSPSGPPPTNWDADYDPRVPNDYVAWKEVHRKRREAIKRIRRQEADDDDETRFAPPQTAPHEQDEEDKMYLSPPPPTATAAPLPPPPPPPGPPPSAPNLNMTGEEAYQRRLAMSRQMQSESGEEAYQRRLAMGQQQEPTTIQHHPPQPPQHDSTPSSAPATAPAPRDLESSRNAAAAIAARLAQKSSAFRSTAAGDDPDDDGQEHRPDPAAFAERLMAKWGHTQGQGLGAEGNQGRTEALIMEKVTQAHRGGPHDPSTASASRGKFTTADPRVQEDFEKYGSPSEVIYLGNILSTDEEEDDDLPQDIAEECNKFGIVQRVALHPPSRGCFVRFSGPAGAWKAVRELNGRFFAGSKIHARYYDRGRFDRGDVEGI